MISNLPFLVMIETDQSLCHMVAEEVILNTVYFDLSLSTFIMFPLYTCWPSGCHDYAYNKWLDCTKAWGLFFESPLGNKLFGSVKPFF